MVSISTVSLVLNGRDEGRVKAPLAALVREKADELGYTVNPLARSLRTCRTRILGFISEEVATTPYAGGIILGAQDAASTYGYMLFTVSTDGKASEENEIATLKRYGVDGFFYSKMSNRIAHVPESLSEYPVVMVDATDHENKVPSIEPDEFMIGYDATNRLIQAGCKRIAYVGCAENMIAQDGRLAGYRTALQEAGRAFNPSLVCNVMNYLFLEKMSSIFKNFFKNFFRGLYQVYSFRPLASGIPSSSRYFATVRREMEIPFSVSFSPRRRSL